MLTMWGITKDAILQDRIQGHLAQIVEKNRNDRERALRKTLNQEAADEVRAYIREGGEAFGKHSHLRPSVTATETPEAPVRFRLERQITTTPEEARRILELWKQIIAITG